MANSKPDKAKSKGLKVFLGEVQTELKKSTWPTRKELMDSTVVVTMSVIIFAAFVAASDGLFIWILQMLVG